MENKNISCSPFLDITTWKEDGNTFFETHNFPAMYEKVRNQPYVMFVGVPGSGKTATARHIALKLQKEEYQILSIKDLKDVDKYCEKDKKRVFVIDDVLGILGFNINQLDLLFRYKDTFKNLSNIDNKVIMTCREEVYRNECFCTTADDFLRKKENVVWLHSAENALNYEDKDGLLKKYQIDASVSEIDLALTSNMFPFLCKLYRKLGNNDPSFFNLPVPIIFKNLHEMENNQPVQYASLVLLMANQNKISKTILQTIDTNGSEGKQIKFLKRCKLRSKPNIIEFINALKRMIQAYTQQCKDEFSFSHDSMFEIVASHFGQENQDLMIQYMSSDYIATKITLNTASISDSECEETSKVTKQRNEHSLSIKLEKVHLRPLAERLYNDLEHGEYYNVFGNIVLKNTKVQEFFIEKIMSTPYEKIERDFILKLKSDLAIRNICNILKEKKGKEENTSHGKCFMYTPHEHLIHESYETECMRAIKWVVFYGHHKILQCIIDKMRAHKENLDNLFLSPNDESNRDSSAVTIKSESQLRSYNQVLNAEKNRLLILGCCSDDPDTVQILMECVDEEVRKIHPLVIACYYGKMRLVKEMIKAKTDVNLIYKKEDTPLIAACRGGHINVVKELIEAGAEVNLAKYDCSRSRPDRMNREEWRKWRKITRDLNERTIDFQRFECKTPIVVACKNRNIELIQLLINKGADFNVSNHLAGTPLTNACKAGHNDVVELLLEHGANVSLIDIDGKTPLGVARAKKHLTIIKQLIDKRFENRDKTLSSACYEGDLNAVKKFIKAGAKVNLNDNVIAPIKAACLAGHADVVKELICEGADVNLWDGDQLPLTTACDEGHLSVVKELINAGANLNQEDEYHTPLTIACVRNHTQIVKELINAKVDVNQAGKNGTPLSIASSNGHLEIAKALLKGGADHNVEHDNKTPLIDAILCEDVELLNMMIESRAVVNFAPALKAACLVKNSMMVNRLLNADANTNLGEALVYACRKENRFLTIFCREIRFHLNLYQKMKQRERLDDDRHEQQLSIVKRLIKAGADVNYAVKYYGTPLENAIRNGYLSAVKELLKNDAVVNMISNKKTPLITACFGGHLNVVKELVEAGADVNLETQGNTPLKAACARLHRDIVKELINLKADVNCIDRESAVLSILERFGRQDILNDLKEAGVDVSRVNTKKHANFFE